MCRSVNLGNSLDIIEIDAASNTGVDNIRELIEKAQFAPVQCRKKVYIVDECLTGDSLIQTSQGLTRIDNPNLKGQQVLSYNETTQNWEYKKVLRWLDQGQKQTLIIQTTHRQIQCTSNHLIRTEQGWIAAKDLKQGMKILSPVKKDIQPQQKHTQEKTPLHFTTTPISQQKAAENGLQTSNNIPSPQWNTNLETVESVRAGGLAKVYDLEVEENHNFIANGLCVHNCHMLSTAAFNSLLKTLEEPPSHVVFILATTDPQRVLPTIISRCQRFDFRRIPLDAMTNHLQDIAQKENIEIQNEALTLIAQIAQGGLRDAESLLDQLSLLIPPITPEKVWDLVGAVPERDLITLLVAIDSQKPEDILTQARNIMNRGREPLILLQNLASFYRDLLIAKTAPNRNDLVAVTAPTWQEMSQLVQNWTLDKIISSQQHLRQSETQIKNTTQPRLWLELTLLGLLQAPTPQPQPQPQPQQTYTPQPQPQQTYTPQPTPQPQPQPTPQPIPTDSNLDQTWQQVLAQLDGPSSAIFKQHGQLINIEENIAYINIKSRNLLAYAQPKIPKLEQAFSQLFQQKITIRLSVTGTPTSTPKNQPPPSPDENNPTPPPTPPTTQLNPVNTPPPPANKTAINSVVTNKIPTQKPPLETAIQTLIQTFNGREISNPLAKPTPPPAPIEYTTTTNYNQSDLETNYLDDGEDNDETEDNFNLDF